MFDISNSNPDEGNGVLYRCDYSEYNSKITLHYYIYPIIKITDKGCWIRVYGDGLKNDLKFVLSGARKQWASKTKKESLYAFKRRKERQIKIMTSQLANVKLALIEANKSFN